MNNLVNLKVKNQHGKLVELDVLEIVEVDGRPYEGDSTSLRDYIVSLDARLQQLERMLSANLNL